MASSTSGHPSGILSTVSSTPPPPGFYDDGSGTRRWWDGRGWTEHLQQATTPTPAAAPRRNNRAGIGCLVVVGLVLAGSIAALIGSSIGGGSTSQAALDLTTSASIAQDDCHDQVSSQIGSAGLAYSAEDVVADHNGKGPGIMASGTVAQNGSQYFFQCSATAVAGGDVKNLKLVTFMSK